MELSDFHVKFSDEFFLSYHPWAIHLRVMRSQIFKNLIFWCQLVPIWSHSACTRLVSLSQLSPWVPWRCPPGPHLLAKWPGLSLPELAFHPEPFPPGQLHEEGSSSRSHPLLQNEEDQVSKPDVVRCGGHRGARLPGPLLPRTQVGCLQWIHGSRQSGSACAVKWCLLHQGSDVISAADSAARSSFLGATPVTASCRRNF